MPSTTAETHLRLWIVTSPTVCVALAAGLMFVSLEMDVANVLGKWRTAEGPLYTCTRVLHT